MTWHLKDRVIEQKLNELSNGEFSKILNESDMKNPNCICFTIDKKEDIELSVYLRPEAIEPEYDPHAWNEYPDVTPPFDKDMRVELDDGLRYCARYHKFSDGCFWVSTNGTCFPNYLNYKVVRFRPWED
jgi:hypothetical protein